ncbi:MAG: hypothetical protein ACFE75_09590, partial [Candidatus Hodarchaeota archaeon]
KKILTEQKNWRGVPTFLGFIALVVGIALIIISYFIVMGIPIPIVICIICITLLYDAKYRGRRAEKQKYTIKSEYREKISDIMEEMDKIDDLKTFLKEKLSSDWEKIKLSFEAYKAGEIEKGIFINTALKNVGNKFIEIFTDQKSEKLNDR